MRTYNKILLSIVIIIGINAQTNGQISLGVRAGTNLGSWNFTESTGDQKKTHLGLIAGLVLDIGVAKFIPYNPN